ncbi:hypothetical protein [Streptomyces sp. JJ36]|uniref:hypothetical protein n=1 Tax=Streptomyces sp. JJ36 TaxID=2736645 RepID=UPI001F3F9B30|nr:hypothetical protein [Streptomyces sp. JJ36]MCF6525793.1 hypothetical protein [Streptomyces sp. JJ36]
MDFLTSALLLTWVAVLLLALVVSGLVRQVHQLSREAAAAPGHTARPPGLPPGSTAPGVAALLGDETPRDGAVLLFLSAGCRTCTEVLAEAARWAAGRPGGPPAVSDGHPGTDPRPTPEGTLAAGGRPATPAPAVRALYAGPVPEAERHPAVPATGDRPDLFTRYDAVATPFAVVVDEAGRVRDSAPLGSAAALTGLLDTAFPPPARSPR